MNKSTNLAFTLVELIVVITILGILGTIAFLSITKLPLTNCTSGQGFDGTSCVTATQCKTGFESITLSNGQTWSCNNLGATTVWDGITQPTNCLGESTNCNAGNTWLGDYYQWGRNDTGFTNGNSGSPYNYGWEAQNDSKWGGTTSDTIASDGAGTTAIGRQGPCPAGWHVPSVKDWQTACNTISGTSCANNSTTVNAMKGVLKLSFSGFRYWSNGYYTQSNSAYYWSSSPHIGSAYNLLFSSNIIYSALSSNRSFGSRIRCLKN